MNEFQSAQFTVHDWINEACRKKPQGESIDKYLTQLETKLQLRCEEVEKEIETCSVQLAREIPQVVTKIAQIKAEVGELETSVTQTADALSEKAAAADSVIGGIYDLHEIKSNMQSACSSLKEATELSELFVRVDAVFNAGDIFAMAKVMATMHRSLKLVGNVPEFESGKQKMKSLEENLISSIKGQLSSAISQRKDDQALKLAEVLVSLDAQKTLEEAYVLVKKKEMDVSIKEFVEILGEATITETKVLECVKKWYNIIFQKICEEAEWCLRLFPSYGLTLVSSLLGSSLQKLKSSLDVALKQISLVSLYISVQNLTLRFTIDMVDTFPSTYETLDIVSLALDLSESEIVRSVQIERSTMMQMINQMQFTSPDAREIIQEMESFIITIFTFAREAVERNIMLTGGTELIRLSSDLEACLNRYVSDMIIALKPIRAAILPTQTSLTNADTDLDTSAILHLIKIGVTLSDALLDLQESMHVISKRAWTELGQKRTSIDVFFIAQERLQRSSSKAAQNIETLLDILESSTWANFDSVHQSIDGFKATTEALVFDSFMQKPRSLFSNFSSMKEWSKSPETVTQDFINLPQFSTYPLQYISSFGEYLMLVPQQIEALVSNDLELDDQKMQKEEEMASSLLNRIINGATDLYADEILNITHLTLSGEAQLMCDLQYFSNVLSAMGTPLAPPLSTVYEGIKTPIEKLKLMVTEGQLEGNQLNIFKTIIEIRSPK